jgi:hypothetical protein
MNVMYLPHITRVYVRSNLDMLFIFGDNDKRQGFGGQAKEMRGEPNTYGIRVKKSPAMMPDSFYTDDEYDENIIKIDNDIETIIFLMQGYKILVIPSHGVGTGLANLKIKAPKTFTHLCNSMQQEGIYNGLG